MSFDSDLTDLYIASPDDRGKRLDVVLASRYPDLSRSQIKRAIGEGRVCVNDGPAKAGLTLRPGDRIVFRDTTPRAWNVEAEDIPLSVVFEDESIIVIDKPPGLVVHPGAGNDRGTLVNALLFHCRDLSGVGGSLRQGIVHRLDKNTSGIMVAAKNDDVHRSLARQFKNRQVTRLYKAVVAGAMPRAEGVIEAPIGRHRTNRKKMTTSTDRGRQAVTRWNLSRAFGRVASLLDVRIETGRTHQIRVHLKDIGHPVLGDAVYGSRSGGIHALRQGGLQKALKAMNRQALHAAALGLYHPLRKKHMEFTAPLPEDMTLLLSELEKLTGGTDNVHS
ncbi:MAG: RluA family pseudouridine synthase [Syntrophales bacterium]|jgi:23S rRNA pseudouridine1911/1915/1917 synthase|nr:RluA family pseudouridine synthase [Syntrophales bacterium]MCK9527529.1 RluA family pseudouridine synthase [Syntrophales bacterium]MDX9922586.1 RluA family pseudouridine synthase [Syntrophales bacterium]